MMRRERDSNESRSFFRSPRVFGGRSRCGGGLRVTPPWKFRLPPEKQDDLTGFFPSYNDTKDTGYKAWEYRKDAVVKYVRTVKPDLHGFQEVRPTQANYLKNGLSDLYGWYDIDRNTGKDISSGTPATEGVALAWRLDRFKVEDKDKGFIWLADNPHEIPGLQSDGTFCWGSGCRRVLIWVKATDLKHDNRTVWFFATHFDNKSSEARQKSAELCISQILEVTGFEDLNKDNTVPIYLVGDLNCVPTSTDINTLKASMYNAANNAPDKDVTLTFNGFTKPQRTLDYIYYVGPVQPKAYRVHTEDYGVEFISDHYPITFEALYK